MSGQREPGQEPVADRQSIIVSLGEELQVTLADLPGAGYEWVARVVPDGLAFVASEWAEPAAAGAGAPRARTVRFRADEPGTYVLVLDLVRPWEPVDTPPVGRRTLDVSVLPLP